MKSPCGATLWAEQKGADNKWQASSRAILTPPPPRRGG